MNSLTPDWITTGIIDFEYKKYILLAYLQTVAAQFNDQKVYPFLSDLIFHYENLVSLKENKMLARQQFPRKISKIDLEKMAIEYEEKMNDSGFLSVIEEIIDFALPRIVKNVTFGKELHDFVEENISIAPVGILPLRKNEGYLLIKNGQERKADVFEFGLTLFEGAKENFRGLRTTYVTSFAMGLTQTFESIKVELIKNRTDLPNPAVYSVEAKKTFPVSETLLPVARRSLVRILCTPE